MSEALLIELIELFALAAVLGVATAAGRRFWLSRGGNSPIYATLAGLAAIDCVAMGVLTLVGRPVPGGLMAMALAVFAIWLAVREITRRIDPADPPPRFEPVFTTARRARASPVS